MTKLDWNFDATLDCEVAFHNGYRIRAERDETPENPFEAWDGNWPIAIYYDGSVKVYEKIGGPALTDPLSRFTDAQLVHDQKALTTIFGYSVRDLLDTYTFAGYPDEDTPTPNWCKDGDVLRQCLTSAFDDVEKSHLLDTLNALYELLGVPCYQTTSTGYSQGDWAKVLVVATPEAVKEFGCKDVTASDLESTADLYSAWAWGDVYGYVIEKPVLDEDGEIEEWEEIEHGSCWGYYGADHDKSGLEEAALESVPDEPVRSPDTFQEAA